MLRVNLSTDNISGDASNLTNGVASPATIVVPMVHQILLWLQSPIGALILLFNSVTLILLWKADTMQTSLRTLFVNMAITDAAAGGIFLFNCVIYYNPHLLNAVTCGIRYMLLQITILVSLANIGLLSVDRCLTLSYPLRYPHRVTGTCAAIVCVTIWITTIIMTYFTYKGTLQSFVVCKFLVLAQHNKLMLVPAIFFYITVTVVIVSYIFIIRTARMHLRKIKTEEDIAKSVRDRDCVPSVAPWTEQGISNAHPSRSVNTRVISRFRYLKTVTILLATIFVCYLPLLITLTYLSVWTAGLGSGVTAIILNSTLFIVILNSLANPVLYTWKTPELHKQCLRLFCSHGHRCTECQRRRETLDLSSEPNRTYDFN